MDSKLVGFTIRVMTALIFSIVGTIGLSGFATAAPQIFTVTFHNNAPGVNNVSLTQSDSSATALQAFSSMGFSNPNYYFEDWTTQSDGGGTVYQDQATYVFTVDLDLYAHWIQVSHSVAFFSNLTTSDSTHVIETGNAPAKLTSFASMDFVNNNFLFSGWNTQRNGGGRNFQDQATYSFVADLQLYAQWSPDKETLSFSANTGNGSVTSMSSSYGSTITLPSGANLSKADFKLVGWNTNSLGTGTEYRLGQTVDVTGSETLYAKWSRLSYVVNFATPGVKGKVAPITVLAGNSVHLRPSARLVKPGFTFAGWYSAPTNGALVGKSGSLLTPPKSLTLYAQWKGNPFVSLEFSDNGGVGHIPARHARSGLSVVVPSGTGIHRGGFLFRGWASSPRAPGPTVRIGARLVLSHTRILYALWRRRLSPHTPQVLLGSVGIFAPNSTALTSTMRHYIASLAIGINQHNRTLVILYGYATSKDSAKGSALLSLQRALAVEKQLNADLARLNDVGVTVRAVGEGRLSNSVLASFRNVEVFSN